MTLRAAHEHEATRYSLELGYIDTEAATNPKLMP